MSIVISDEKSLEIIEEVAKEKQQSPEQVVAAAIVAYTSPKITNGDRFWESVTGLSNSGDPTFTEK